MKNIINFLHHLFIPHEENNFRAKALHTDFLTYYLLIALFLTFAFKYTALSNVLGFATDITIDKLYSLTNSQREKNGLSDLSYNDQLSQAAQKKAQDMFANNYWAHYGPKGETPWDFILASGYQYEYAGENLAKNFLFSQAVVDAWMASPTHRENILRSNYTQVGFAVVNGVLNGEQTTLVVQMFGRPAGATLAKTTNPTVKLPQPTIAPTVQPIQPQVETGAKEVILAKEANKPALRLFDFSFNLNAVFLGFLLLALALDFYFASKLNVIRIGGKNLAHFIFISFIFLGLFLFTRGAIL